MHLNDSSKTRSGKLSHSRFAEGMGMLRGLSHTLQLKVCITEDEIDDLDSSGTWFPLCNMKVPLFSQISIAKRTFLEVLSVKLGHHS